MCLWWDTHKIPFDGTHKTMCLFVGHTRQCAFLWDIQDNVALTGHTRQCAFWWDTQDTVPFDGTHKTIWLWLDTQDSAGDNGANAVRLQGLVQLPYTIPSSVSSKTHQTCLVFQYRNRNMTGRHAMVNRFSSFERSGNDESPPDLFTFKYR